jgi:hypothetical protein
MSEIVSKQFYVSGDDNRALREIARFRGIHLKQLFAEMVAREIKEGRRQIELSATADR